MHTIRHHRRARTVAYRIAAVAGRDDTAFVSILGTLILLWAVAVKLLAG